MFDLDVRTRIVVSAVAIVAVLAAMGLGGYLYVRSAKPPARAGAVALGGTRPAAQTQAAFLSVVSSTPTSGSNGIALDAKLTLNFNRPVDAAGVQPFFSIQPDVQGQFAQGASPQQIVFAPKQPFGAGVEVKAALRAGLASRDGFVLPQDFVVGFETTAPAQGVLFQAAGEQARMLSIQSGGSAKVSPFFGDKVPASINLNIYKAGPADLLRALVHDDHDTFPNGTVDVSRLSAVSSQTVKSRDVVTVTQPDGIYVLVAGSGQAQYGTLWLDFSKYGVLARQDDQKIVLAGEDLSSGDTAPQFSVSFYNLLHGVQQLGTGSFAGTGEFASGYPSNVDVVLAEAGGETVLIPLSIPETTADIKVVGNLAQTPQLYITTDRPAYRKGETVRFAGVARVSNDQTYSLPAGMHIGVWIDGPSPVRQDVAVAADGTFSGSLALPDSAFNADGSPAAVTIHAGDPSAILSPVLTTVEALGGQSAAGRVAISFDKASYFSGDTVTASLLATGANGQPLANQAVSVAVYAAKHDARPAELDRFAAPSTLGVAVQDQRPVQLSASGRGTITFPANIAKDPSDAELTVVATAANAQGSATVIVQQAADRVFLLPARSAYVVGQEVRAPLVVETTDGQRVPGASLSYELDRTTYQGSSATTSAVGQGTLSTDQSGLGLVSTTYQGPADWLTLKVTGKDSDGRTFQDMRPITFAGDPASLTFAANSTSLSTLDVTTDKIAYSVGDSATLNVRSAAAGKYLLSLERGRIHLYRWLTVAAGENQVSFPITPDLAPGFTATFSHFADGAFATEGLPISISNRASLLKVAIAPDQPAYRGGQTAHVSVTVTDSAGRPVPATLILDAYEAAMSAGKLVDQPSLARAFLAPANRATNASSSLSSIGAGGGRCGGGDNTITLPPTPSGQVAAWSPGVHADASGHATLDVPVARAERISVLAATTSGWGQAEVDLSAS